MVLYKFDITRRKKMISIAKKKENNNNVPEGRIFFYRSEVNMNNEILLYKSMLSSSN